LRRKIPIIHIEKRHCMCYTELKVFDMKIKNINLKNEYALAPMAGFTDKAMRILCKENGAGLLVSEMVSARGIYYNDKKTKLLMEFCEYERPFSVQLFCNEPHIMAYAAAFCEQLGVDMIDINMGCPMPKIVNNGDGSALMKNPLLAGKLVEAAVKEVKIPISVKMRLGWDEKNKNCIELARICEQNGASFISVHGRTREGMYSAPIDYETISKVVEAVKISVFGNGNICDVESAEKMRRTGCAGLMIGRAAIGNPFVFKTVKDGFEPTVQDKLDMALRHFKLLCEFKGENIAVKEIRPHIAAYLKGIKNSHIVKCKIFETQNAKEIEDILQSIGKD